MMKPREDAGYCTPMYSSWSKGGVLVRNSYRKLKSVELVVGLNGGVAENKSPWRPVRGTWTGGGSVLT